MFDTKKISRKILWGGGKTVLVLLTGICSGFAALCLVHLLPVDRMYRNVYNNRDAVGDCAQVVMGYEQPENLQD